MNGGVEMTYTTDIEGEPGSEASCGNVTDVGMNFGVS
jgi:hypothetical protein